MGDREASITRVLWTRIAGPSMRMTWSSGRFTGLSEGWFENSSMLAGAGVNLSALRPVPLCRTLDTKTGSGLDTVEVDTGLSG